MLLALKSFWRGVCIDIFRSSKNYRAGLYAISPIDLIPDFIPVLGLLDDIILVPAGAALAIKLIPKEVMDDARKQAAADEAKKLPKDWRVGAGVVGIWALGLGWTAWKVYNAWTSGGAEVAEAVYNITQT